MSHDQGAAGQIPDGKLIRIKTTDNVILRQVYTEVNRSAQDKPKLEEDRGVVLRVLRK